MNEQEQNEFLINKGILRKVYETKEFEMYALCGTGYIAHEKGNVNKENGLNVYLNLEHTDATALMQRPTLEMLYAIIVNNMSNGKNKFLVFTEKMINKCETLKEKVAKTPEFQIKPHEEAKLLKRAQEYFKNHQVEQSAPGMGGR